jgi:hypothetical protein
MNDIVKVWTIEWTASNDDITEFSGDSVKVIGTDNNTPEKSMVFLDIAYTRKKWHFSYKVTDVRPATAEELERHNAKLEQERINKLLSN